MLCHFQSPGMSPLPLRCCLIDIIEDCNLHVKTSLPVALLQIDKNLSQVTAPGSIKRACLNRVKYGQELHERMDLLYTSSEDEIGPFCTKMGIKKKWLSDHHQYDLEPGMIVTNGAILELYQYIKNAADLNWADGVRCLARFYPDREHELPVPKVWQSEYQLSNRATPAASVDNIVTEDDPGLKDDGVDETTGVDSDFFHRQYDSSIKQKLVQHIREQDAEIEHLNKHLRGDNCMLLAHRP